MSRFISSLANITLTLEEAVAEASLNAGNELPDVEIDITPSNNFLLSDLYQNEVGLVALEDRVNDLLSLLTKARADKGMSKSIALEAERLIPGFMKTPIEYYTDTTSATMYSVSLEEMSNGMKGIIVAIVVAIIGLIYKIIKWLTGGSSSSGSGGAGSPSISTGKINISSSDLSQAEKKLDKLIEEIQFIPEFKSELISIVEETDDFLGGDEYWVNPQPTSEYAAKLPDGSIDRSKLIRVRSLDQAINALYGELKHNGKLSLKLEKSINDAIHPNLFVLDIVENGELSKTMRDVVSQMSSYVNLSRAAADMLMKLYNELRQGDDTIRQEHENKVSNLSLQRLNKQLDASYNFKIGNVTYEPAKLEAFISSRMHTLRGERTTKQYSFSKICTGIERARDDDKFDGAVIQCKALLEIIRKIILPNIHKADVEVMFSRKLDGLGSGIPAHSGAQIANMYRDILYNVRSTENVLNLVITYMQHRAQAYYTYGDVLDTVLFTLRARITGIGDKSTKPLEDCAKRVKKLQDLIQVKHRY